jgi:Xaa-Pro aminopeptidase
MQNFFKIASLKFFICTTLFLITSIAPLFSQNCQSKGITKEEYASRRTSLIEELDTASAIVMKARESEGEEYDLLTYRQDPGFFYLTGIKEPGVYLFISPKGVDCGGRTKQTILFAPVDSEIMKNQAGCCSETDTILNDESFRDIFIRVMKNLKVLYFSAPDVDFANDWLNDKPWFIITDAKKTLKQKFPGLKLKDAAGLINPIRVIKSPEEIGLIRESVRMTGDGIRNAAKTCKPGLYEFELQAAIEFEMTRQGSETRAFNSIVGSGTNSLILHYNTNNCMLKDGDLVVMDVGSQYCGYAADITRTVPVSGKFTREQKEIYNVVLDVQKQIIDMIAPGVTISDLDKKAAQLITRAGYKSYIQHGVSHQMGLSVHDVSTGDTLAEGMVITVEPGIYIPVEDTKLPSAYHGFGIRIEDDVLVTKTGHEVLSKEIPKEVAEIEKLMK